MYRFKSILFFITLCFGGNAQEDYDNCNTAFELCPNEQVTLNNIGASTTLCPDCEDDFNFCFVPENSIWTTFTTNATGGDVQIDFTNLVFETNAGQDQELNAVILEATVPCNSASYTQVGTCSANNAADFSVTAVGLTPNTEYHVVICGDNAGAGITSAAECSFSIELFGAGVDRPIPTITVSGPTDLCDYETASYQADTTNCPTNSEFRWYINGELQAITSDMIFTTSAISNSDVVEVETDCNANCPILVQNQTSPINVTSILVDAGNDTLIESGEQVQLNGYVQAGTFSWSPSFGVSDTASLSPFVSPTATTTYTLTSEFNGCTFQDFVTVEVESSLFFPNTFSPNGDGINDTWVIKGMEKYPDAQVKILTRWGQIIFQSTGYSKEKAWDGRTNTGVANEGVYFYKVELRDEEKQVIQGSITLIK